MRWSNRSFLLLFLLFLLLPVHLAKRLHLARLLYWLCDGVACFHVRHQVSRVVERPLNNKYALALLHRTCLCTQHDVIDL
ncbi:hypothetical protein XA1311A_01520 [Xanthomonas arboricola]|nr:hypothetical protein XA1311A_01520 [Xanthomonas arboricola]CAE6690002.1 hypothetical protein XA1311A_01520 [Xanthomonas arboricola]